MDDVATLLGWFGRVSKEVKDGQFMEEIGAKCQTEGISVFVVEVSVFLLRVCVCVCLCPL